MVIQFLKLGISAVSCIFMTCMEISSGFFFFLLVNLQFSKKKKNNLRCIFQRSIQHWIFCFFFFFLKFISLSLGSFFYGLTYGLNMKILESISICLFSSIGKENCDVKDQWAMGEKQQMFFLVIEFLRWKYYHLIFACEIGSCILQCFEWTFCNPMKSVFYFC